MNAFIGGDIMSLYELFIAFSGVPVEIFESSRWLQLFFSCGVVVCICFGMACLVSFLVALMGGFRRRR